MRLLALGAVLASSTAAYAGQAEDIAQKAATCWTVPVGTESLTSAAFDVTFDEKGRVADATVRGNRSGTAGEKAFVYSALRALQSCAPYSGAKGKIAVTMEVAQIPAPNRPIDPFK